ncbi:MAG: chromate efflux transporter [Paracoccaceae bacterium]|nr:chromate efflux transporter [Paracoccaceae bacterium]MDG2259222.1 chromate efflux transporter [Paracoccaceae bacterium]
MTSFSDLFRVFGRIGLTSFGGPAAQISLIHKELVDDRPWLTEKEFLSALSFCMLLPGPEAMQLATYCGWKMRGTLGGLIAGLLFVLPGAAIIMVLALGYAAWGDFPVTQSIFLGIKATVIVIVLQALFKLSKKALKSTDSKLIALLSFAGIFLLNAPFPLIILAAGLWGAFKRSDAVPVQAKLPAFATTLKTILVWTVIWALPFFALWVFNASFLTEIAEFFSLLAVVTFGGAYAVLAYMTQAVVGDFGWLNTAEMIDALGLAETTPGPLILVTEFVGILAGTKTAGVGLGLIAGLVTLWVTFAPCFLWIFVGAPYIDWLSAQPRINNALSSISAAVVGVIFNLSVWFALNVYFNSVTQLSIGPFEFPYPDIFTLSLLAVMLSIIAAIVMLVLKRSIIQSLLVMGCLGFIVSFF